jgi:hypothetical protein
MLEQGQARESALGLESEQIGRVEKATCGGLGVGICMAHRGWVRERRYNEVIWRLNDEYWDVEITGEDELSSDR